MATQPIELHDNGEWEIKSTDGKVMQYGLWEVRGGRMLWTVKLDGRIVQDVNTVLAVREKGFELRERDGATTRFERLD